MSTRQSRAWNEASRITSINSQQGSIQRRF